MRADESLMKEGGFGARGDGGTTRGDERRWVTRDTESVQVD